MTTYISDRGDEYIVTSMDTSHLINAIGHHLHQIETLSSLSFATHISNRRRVLLEVVEILRKELATRKPIITEYVHD